MLKKFLDIISKDMGDTDKKVQEGLSKLKVKKEIVIGTHRVQIEKKIAEGGYADIYKVIDCNLKNKEHSYALKRMFIEGANNSPLISQSLESFKERPLGAKAASQVVLKAYEVEITILKHLNGSSYLPKMDNSSSNCENLIKIVDHQENERLNGYEVYLLLEYCPNGTLFDLIEEKCKQGFGGVTNEGVLMKVVNDIASGLCHLH